MRNGILGVFGGIIIRLLSRDDLDDTLKKSRESFLDHLEVSALLMLAIKQCSILIEQVYISNI